MQLRRLFHEYSKGNKYMKYSHYTRLLRFYDNFVYDTVLFGRPPNYTRGQQTMALETIGAFSKYMQAYILSES